MSTKTAPVGPRSLAVGLTLGETIYLFGAANIRVVSGAFQLLGCEIRADAPGSSGQQVYPFVFPPYEPAVPIRAVSARDVRMTASAVAPGASAASLSGGTTVDRDASKAVLQAMYASAPSVGCKPYAEDFQKAVIELTPMDGMEGFLSNFDLSKRSLPAYCALEAGQLSLSVVPGCCVLKPADPAARSYGEGKNKAKKRASKAPQKSPHSIVLAALPSSPSSSPPPPPPPTAAPAFLVPDSLDGAGPKSRVCVLPFRYPKAWRRAHSLLASSVSPSSPSAPLQVMVVGAKGAGKSTFSRMLLNRLCTSSSSTSVAWLDLDVGQSEFSLPGTLSLSLIGRPVLTPPYLRPQGPAEGKDGGGVESVGIGVGVGVGVGLGLGVEVLAMRYFGDSSVASDPSLFVALAKKLVTIYRTHPSLAPKGVPLIVNAHGWLKGFGYETLQETAAFLRPTDLVFLDSSSSSNYSGGAVDLGAAEVEENDNDNDEDDEDGDVAGTGAGGRDGRALYSSHSAPYLLRGATMTGSAVAASAATGTAQQSSPFFYPPVVIAPSDAVDALTTTSSSSGVFVDGVTAALVENARRRERFILPDSCGAASGTSVAPAVVVPRVHWLRAWHMEERHEGAAVAVVGTKQKKKAAGTKSKHAVAQELEHDAAEDELIAVPALAKGDEAGEPDLDGDEEGGGNGDEDGDEEGASLPTYEDGESDGAEEEGEGKAKAKASRAGRKPAKTAAAEADAAIAVDEVRDEEQADDSSSNGSSSSSSSSTDTDDGDSESENDELALVQHNLPPPRAARSPSDLRAQRLLIYFLRGAVASASTRRGSSDSGSGSDSDSDAQALASAVFRAVLSDHKIARAPSLGMFSPASVFCDLAVPLIVPLEDVLLAPNASALVPLADADADAHFDAATDKGSSSASSSSSPPSSSSSLSLLAQGFEGQVVGLCSRQLWWRSLSSSSPSSASASSSSTPVVVPAGCLPCLALGYVKSFDRISNELHILTPLSLDAAASAGIDVLVSWRPPGSGGAGGGHDVPSTLLYRASPHGDPFTCESGDLKSVKQGVAAAAGKPQRKNLKRARLLVA